MKTMEEWLAPGLAQRALEKSLDEEVAVLAAHLNAGTARLLELAMELRRQGGGGDDFGCWLAFRCGITLREAREYVRVAEALEELPLLRAAFRRGAISLTKLRALTRVATAPTEAGLLELAEVLTASQLERALRAYRRVTAEQAGDTHQLEYVDYYWEDDGSLVLRARLAAEDGTVLVQALEAARERAWQRHRAEHSSPDAIPSFETPRPAEVEALLELAHATPTGGAGADLSGRARLVVHVDAAVLTDDTKGRCDLDEGPVIAAETARRLGCDADQVTVIERDGIPVSVGRSRRTVTPTLRRLLEARDGGCCWPGCDRQRWLDAHHLRHWAHGGETSLDNLVLLCQQHHRLVHEGGYTVECDSDGQLGFRNRHGLLHPTVAGRPPPGRADALIDQNHHAGLQIDAHTNRTGCGEPMNLIGAVDAFADVFEHVLEH